MKVKILLFFLVLICTKSFAQKERLQTEWFLYWQPDTKIQYIDYQKQPDSTDFEFSRKYNIKLLTNVQIHAVLDYPKKARKVKTLGEKWYLAPVFCKKCSPIYENDSVELLQAQVFFDIAEHCTRLTRMKIAELEKQDVAIGMVAASFPRLVEDMYALLGEMFASYGKQVIIDKEPGKYEEWRTSVDEMLKQTIGFETKQVECDRLILEKPLSDEYLISYEKYGVN